VFSQLSIGPGPGSWVAYGILLIVALVYLSLLGMLLVKSVEGLIRLIAGIGFDKHKRTPDKGILGVLAILGCCGQKRKPRRRSTRRRPALVPPRIHRSASDLSSYMPPPGGIHPDGTATPPRILTADSRKGSANSHPPSVLKPEHANRPYKEDSSDEGNIMGAWQPFSHASGSGYMPIVDGSQTSSAPKLTSPSSGGGTGFTRVGGGRAHIDSPYAIASGSTHTFPSIGQQSQIFATGGANQSRTASPMQTVLQVHSLERNVDEDVPLSVSNVGAGLGQNGLSLGDMHAAHVRTKSQTAIVEDYPSHSASFLHKIGPTQLPSMASMSNSKPSFLRPKYLSQDTFLQPPITAPAAMSKFTLGDDNEDGSGGEEADQKKKTGGYEKKWYHIRRNRPYSIEGRPSATSSISELEQSRSKLELDQEMGGLGLPASSTQRSFVVIRKPPSSLGRSSQQISGSANVGKGNADTTGFETNAKANSRPPTR